MNIYKQSIFALLAMVAVSNCNSENDIDSGASSEYINSVRVTVEDFLPGTPSTRTDFTVDGSGFHFQWVDGDALGIYPVGGDQVKFPISSGDGSATASFDGGAWRLRSEYQYAAYYPFSVDNYNTAQTALPVSFTGQTQNGNASTAHLGAYDYLACAATSPDSNGGVDLSMKHLGAFLRLQLTMPVADTYSSVVLESDGAQFVTAGTFDLTAATPTITPNEYSPTYTIDLTNVTTTENNQVVTVYAIVAPADLSTSNITVTVQGTGRNAYAQTVPGKDFVARSAYSIEVDNLMTSIPFHAYVDLGLSVKWATMNVGASAIEERGEIFRWGETEPSSGSTYKFKADGYFTKYAIKDNPLGFTNGDFYDDKDTLEPEDDAAHVNWGGSWRMPTKDEINELLTCCTWTEESYNGIEGWKVTAYNGNFIFLPCSSLWSSTIGPSGLIDAYTLALSSGRHQLDGISGIRELESRAIRPVRP